jgi:hypothetical protein
MFYKIVTITILAGTFLIFYVLIRMSLELYEAFGNGAGLSSNYDNYSFYSIVLATISLSVVVFIYRKKIINLWNKKK